MTMIGGRLADAQPSKTASIPDVRLEEGRFVVGGRPFIVKGIHYGPWRPGTGPNKGYPYPPLDGIAEDFRLIRDAHANTVLLVDAPPGVLDLADEHGLRVIYCFALDWWSIGGERQADMRSAVLQRVQAVRRKPALLAWMLGNEIPADALAQRGDAVFISGLRDLYQAVKSADPAHPVSHANWPITRHLDLGFLDFTSVNVYPLWPPEVVAMGFGRYIERVLKPLAGTRPLLISEFGVNTIEGGVDGQARLLRDSWTDLMRAGAAGGVVFEFADEWWKNYNNPIRSGNWWTRQPAPDDELRHDEDPEEAYGIVEADRRPKPAYRAVADMYVLAAPASHESARRMAGATIGAIVALAAGAWILSRRPGARGRVPPRV